MSPEQAVRESRRGRRPALTTLVLLAGGLASLLLASCSGRIGWGVVLWPSDDGRVSSGSLTPVYLKSNIEKLYVVGVPGEREKVELPLWRLEFFPSRAKAKARVEEFGDLARSWLITARDGLPVRESPTNAGKRVYRLREGESVKILARVKGDAVMTGGEALAGDWYLVLAGEGVRGYVFSNTMRLYEEGASDAPTLAKAEVDTGSVDLIFSRVWRPEYFQEMVDDQRIDLDLFTARYGFFTDALRRQVRLELPGASEIFNYSSIDQEGAWFTFEGTPLRVRILGSRRFEADWTGRVKAEEASLSAPPSSTTTSPAAAEAPLPVAAPPSRAAGAEGRAIFLALAEDIRDAVRAEELRRQKLLEALLAYGSSWTYAAPLPPAGSAQGEAAPLPPAAPAQPAAAVATAPGSPPPAPGELIPAAPEAGLALAEAPAPGRATQARLFLSPSRLFSWKGIAALPYGYVPQDLQLDENGGASGELTVRLALSADLAERWEGVVSLRFNGQKGWTDFLWRRAPGGLEILPVAPASISDQTAGAAAALPALLLSPSTQE